MTKYTVGVDVGGTNIKFGLVSASGKIIARSRLETKNFTRSKKSLIEAMAQAILNLLQENKLTIKNVAGIGIGLPGLVDPKKGVVIVLPNVPGWSHVPLKRMLQDQLKVPVFIDNDVNVITLGEWQYGAGKNYQNLICMTLGTGVGGGLILNNTLYRGEGFAAGELGHIPLNEKGPDCACGGFGCLECYVGNRYLGEAAGKIFKIKDMTPPDITRLAKEGNTRAVEFWEKAGEHIGNGLVGVINLLNPRLVIIGGGVSNNLNYMKPAIERVIQKRVMSVQKKMVKIVRAKLEDDAGILGAHVLVKSQGV